MPSDVIKMTPEEDAYFLWTTVADGPASHVMTREIMAKYLYDMNLYRAEMDETPAQAIEALLARADDIGTSSADGDPGAWDQKFWAQTGGGEAGYEFLTREQVREWLKKDSLGQ